MAFNRWADADLDAANPRTSTRAIPAGLLSRRFVSRLHRADGSWFLSLAACRTQPAHSLPLAARAHGFARLQLYEALTRWSHLVLGLALGLAPSAAWIAVRGSLDPRIVVLTAAVTLWAGGFDVLYACQDFEHDRAAGLYSLPQRHWNPECLLGGSHHAPSMLALLVWFGMLFHFLLAGWVGIAAVGVAAGL